MLVNSTKKPHKIDREAFKLVFCGLDGTIQSVYYQCFSLNLVFGYQCGYQNEGLSV